MDKYDNFFREIKEFFKVLGAADDTSFIGLSPQEIKDMEEMEGIKITGGFRSHLQHWGKKAAIPFVEVPFLLRSMKQAKEAQDEYNQGYEEHEKNNWVDDISKDLEKKGLYPRDVKPILLFDGLSYDFLYFTLERQAEFYIGMYDFTYIGGVNRFRGVREKFEPYSRFFRLRLFEGLTFELNPNPKYVPQTTIERYNQLYNIEYPNKIPWFKFYRETMKKKPIWRTDLIGSRPPFYKIAHEREMQMGRFFN